MNDPALLELFTCLQKAGFPLGLAEYHLLLEAINAGFGTRDRTSLAQLCSAIWVKSQREEQIFQDYFNQIIPERLEEEFFSKETKENNSTDIESIPIQKKQLTPKKYNTARIILFLVLGLAGCVIAIGSTFILKKFITAKDTESHISTLAFSNSFILDPSLTYFTVDINEKAAHIKITRTGRNHGTVSAELNVGKNCLPDEPNYTLQLDDVHQVNDSPQIIRFEGGKTGEKTIFLPIFNDGKNDFFQKYIRLCLTKPQGKVQLGNPKKAVLVVQNKDYLSKVLHSENLELLLIISTCIILLLVVWKMWKNRQTASSRDEALIPETYANLPKTMLSPEVIRTMADEIQVAKAIRQSDNRLSELFPLIVNDLRLTHRQMKQGWRYLRRFSRREGPPIELDLAATIEQVAQYGILLNPVLVPRRTNRIELLLLIDRDGSMVPFHHLCEELVDTALRGGRFSQVRVYYFHNCPDEYLYRDRYHLEAQAIDDCLSNLPKARTVCLIFSDAGAARGRSNSRRRRLTKFFLKELGQYVRYTTWLNPVPRARWETTTAHDIAALVPMFELNRQEFYRAIDVLRGRALR
ncbi:hypothetical protein [Nostoc sp. CCY 9925]|uniref:hypothetical protein n=1 Tax=Nostoc sp. CCY 9925 TaxID=3103865 RepID=UPI0039C6E16F